MRRSKTTEQDATKMSKPSLADLATERVRIAAKAAKEERRLEQIRQRSEIQEADEKASIDVRVIFEEEWLPLINEAADRQEHDVSILIYSFRSREDYGDDGFYGRSLVDRGIKLLRTEGFRVTKKSEYSSSGDSRTRDTTYVSINVSWSKAK